MSALFAKIISFFMAILAFFGLVKPGEAPNMDLTDGIKIEVVSQDINIYLESNPSTGYHWKFTQDSNNVLLITEEHIKTGTNGLLGAGGVEHFKFLAVAPGEATLTFKYGRTGEPTYARVVRVSVSVDSNMNVECKYREENIDLEQMPVIG